MSADGLKPSDLGRALPKLYGVAVNKLLGSFPCCGLVRHLNVDSGFYVSVWPYQVRSIFAHESRSKTRLVPKPRTNLEPI